MIPILKMEADPSILNTPRQLASCQVIVKSRGMFMCNYSGIF
jgi:hypothetical protein